MVGMIMKFRRALAVLALGISLMVIGGGRGYGQEAGYTEVRLSAIPEAGVGDGFKLLKGSSATGIAFTNRLSERSAAENRVLLNGSGVCAGDFDNDGLPDIFLCGLDGPNALFRNAGGLKFELMDGTGFEALSMDGVYSRGAVMADINGDGWRDLLVTTVGSGTKVFLNQSGRGFSDVTEAWGLASVFGSSTLTLADYNRDGFLDLYVANNRASDIRDQGRLKVRMINGKPQVPRELQDRITFINGVLNEFGEPDQLFLNHRGNRFLPVSWTGGTFIESDGSRPKGPPLDWGLSASFRDVNNDGWPDLYVCNDFWTPDRFWINRGDGSFQALGLNQWRNSPASSMGVDFSDLNGDGLVDFFAVDMLSRDPSLRKRQKPAQSMSGGAAGELFERPQLLRNTLYRNFGDLHFAEIAHFAGVEASDWSWNPVFMDVDLDGLDDILISAGHELDVQDMDAMMKVWSLQKDRPDNLTQEEVRRQYIEDMIEHNRIYPPLPLPVVSFRNQGEFHFEETTEMWGMSATAVRHGLATADFDGDGDQDVIFNCLNSAAEIYINQSEAPRLAVKLLGTAGNSDAVGARLKLVSNGLPDQIREIISGGRYLSGGDSTVTFAAANSGGTLTISWPKGNETILSDLKPGFLYTINHPDSDASRRADAGKDQTDRDTPLMKAVESGLPSNIAESDFDDFSHQSLLPYRLSRRGPGLTSYDVNGDGHQDLLIGDSGSGGPILALNDGNGQFTRKVINRSTVAGGEISFFLGGGGKTSVLAFQDGYEARINGGVHEVDSGNLSMKPAASSGGGIHGGWAAAMTWLPSRNTLALVTSSGPGEKQFPNVGDVALYLKSGNNWKRDQATSDFLKSLGLVSSAVWTDMNQDGHPDLVVAVHWGGVHILMQENGVFVDRSDKFGIPAAFNGLWNGLVTGDFNGDGFPDLVASNWGTNSPWDADPVHPLTLSYGEVSRPGNTEIVLTEWSGDYSKKLTWLPLDPLAKAMPFVVRNFRSYKEFSELPVERVIGSRFSLMSTLRVQTLETTLWLSSHGKTLQRAPLPLEVQYAPVFGMSVADFDGNGTDDLFMTQNFSATRPEMAAIDSGYGLMLLGDGDGNFKALGPHESGISLQGDLRAVCAADFDEDGRVDLAVSANGAGIHHFRNFRSQAGLAVRFIGSSANPDALGTCFRLSGDNFRGPLREVQSGTSWLSSGSPVHVLMPSEKTRNGLRIAFRIPGSSQWTNFPVPVGASEVSVPIGN